MCQPDCDKQGAAQRQENIRKLRAIREGVRVRARWEEEGLAAYQSDVLQRIQSLKADIAEHEKTRSEHQGSFAPTPPRLDRRSISSTRMRVPCRVVSCRVVCECSHHRQHGGAVQRGRQGHAPRGTRATLAARAREH